MLNVYACVIKMQNVHAERKQRDLLQNFYTAPFLISSMGKLLTSC